MKEFYYDLHSHILPGVDDGPSSMEETKEMLRIALEEGIHTIIATPHYESAKGQNTEEIQKIIEQVLIEAKTISPDFTIYPGNELYYSDSVIEDLKAKKAFTLAGTNYVLVEFSVRESYDSIFKGLRNLVSAGYFPILAHVERYQCLHKQEERIYDLIDLGAYIQMNCDSLEMGFFHMESKYHRSLLTKGLVHFLSSDCHDTKYRKPLLGSIAKNLRKKVEHKKLDEILIENPKTLLENKYI